MLIEHRLDFTKDWQAANPSFRMGRVDAQGNLDHSQYTSTGHIDNHFSVGPAILWSPFLVAAHAGVLLYDRLGGHVPADGYSRPYRMAMALGTAIYGFLALMISFRAGARICCRPLGISCHAGDLDLPARYLCICISIPHGRTRIRHSLWPLFLWYWTAHAHEPDLGAMAATRSDRRPDDGRLLHERSFAFAAAP